MSSTYSSSFPQSEDRDTASDLETTGLTAPGSTADTTRSGQDLLGRAVHGAHDTIDRFAETAEPHVQRLQQGVLSATEAVRSRAGQLRVTGDAWAESLRTTVRNNPLAALTTALAVGLLVSRLTRR